MKKNQILITAIVAVIVGAAAFFGGMQFQKSQRPNFATFTRQGEQGGNVRFGNGQRGRFGPNGGNSVIGEVVSVDPTGVTVKMQDGSTKIVVVSSSTSINKSDAGSKSDLKEGITIAAFGTSNSDGSITAQGIQINPTRNLRNISVTPSK